MPESGPLLLIAIPEMQNSKCQPTSLLLQEEGPVLLTLFKCLPSTHPQHPVSISPHFQTNSGINSPLCKWPFGLKVTSHGQLPSQTREKPRLPQDPCPPSHPALL